MLGWKYSRKDSHESPSTLWALLADKPPTNVAIKTSPAKPEELPRILIESVLNFAVVEALIDAILLS